MPSTRSKKARARRSREADILSDIEYMDVTLGSGEYNHIERDIDQMTGFSNIFNRDDNEEGHSMRGNSSQDNEIRNMPENRNNPHLSKKLHMLSGEINIRISQEINKLSNEFPNRKCNNFCDFSKIIIPQVQGLVETILISQLEIVQSSSRRPQTTIDEENNVDVNNLHNRCSRSRQNMIEPEDESPYNMYQLFKLVRQISQNP